MLPPEIEQLFDCPPPQYTEEHRRTFEAFKAALNRGEVRAAEPMLHRKRAGASTLG